MTSIRATIRGMAERANPAFAAGAVAIPVAAFAYVLQFGTLIQHTFVHVMAGILWTGIDLFMALVLGPVLGGLAVEERASVFERFTPKMTFLMPTLALVTIGGGVTLAVRIAFYEHLQPWIAILTAASLLPALALIGYQFDAFGDRRWQAAFGLALLGSGAYLAATLPDFAMTAPAIVVAIAIVIVLSVLGFGVLLPGEVRMYRQMVSANPDPDVISSIGMRNARLSGVQGVFQLAIIVVMVYLRYGGF
ncbi:hypothetical protein GCM10009020_04710 [Natronoarchaeum mannanilyticum]|uniref:Uncharacterized protein n=2 Tax=Natronoarchaeum mannanilyticum TaxID=926360 RepID=A0AAV3T5R4_9EURY